MATVNSAFLHELPTLGRPFQLGVLYDCCSDELVPGVALWDSEMIEKDLSVAQNCKTEFKVIASVSIDEKYSALGASTSLKGSLLVGLVEVSGPAVYLNQTNTSKHQARVALHYSATTRIEQLAMEHLNPDSPFSLGILDQNMGTHVVTAVLYGTQAFFVFDRHVSSPECMHDVYEDLKSVVGNIPIIATEGQGVIANNAKDETEKLKCEFYGDFALEHNPCTYNEPVNIYKTLLGLKEENSVPVKVWLYPLSQLECRTPRLVHSISKRLIDDIQLAIEELNDVNMQCNDMLNQLAAVHFPGIKSKVQQFQTLLKQFRESFQKDMARVLPSIRRGKEDEQVLTGILMRKDQSPFSASKVTEFLKAKYIEINLINYFLEVLSKLNEIRIVSCDINQIMLDLNTEDVLSFTFTSLGEEDKYLLELKCWLQSEHMSKSFQPMLSFECEKEKPNEWFSDADIRQKMVNLSRVFLEFANQNRLNQKITFIVSAHPDPTNRGSSIYLYEAGNLTSRDFHPPQSDPPAISKISHDTVWLKPSPLTGTDEMFGCRVEFKLMEQKSWKSIEGSYTKDCTITDLYPNSQYLFRQFTVLERWIALPSETVGPIKTLPTDPPRFLVVLHEKTNTSRLTWLEPDNMGVGVKIGEYKIEYMKAEDGGSEWAEIKTKVRVESWIMEGLKPDMSYRFRVFAICGDAGSSDSSEEYLFPAAVEALSAELERRRLSSHKQMVTLDPDTSHCELVLSESHRRVGGTEVAQTVLDNPKRFAVDTCVLAKEGFSSGRHYWEVELLQDGLGWRVGAASETLNRKKGFRRSPKEGLWALEGDGEVYWACLSPDTRLYLRESPKKLGIYLDYEAGLLSVYNAATMELLYAFTHASFTQKIFPFFYLWPQADLRLV
ncbi:stonustoxin subunit alpha-like [Lissotriton helveticus]